MIPRSPCQFHKSNRLEFTIRTFVVIVRGCISSFPLSVKYKDNFIYPQFTKLWSTGISTELRPMDFHFPVQTWALCGILFAILSSCMAQKADGALGPISVVVFLIHTFHTDWYNCVYVPVIPAHKCISTCVCRCLSVHVWMCVQVHVTMCACTCTNVWFISL